uniref:Reticulon-like protein n=1 Tax=Nelumbo nucifera TaxID=4432 RepID=A0A822XTR7_NELNU|nr:TPA_asm: hypothetical protein HUJ06_023952 [Nelumbo nucifera]
MEKIQAARRRAGARNVVAGSVWESRMKSDEVKQVNRQLNRNQSGVERGKRKTWKTESFDGFERSPFQIRKTRSQSHRFSGESLSLSLDGIDKSLIQLGRRPIHLRKARSESNGSSDESCKELGVSVDGNESGPIQTGKIRSGSPRVPEETCKEKTISVNFSDVAEIKSPQKFVVNDDGVDGDEENDWGDEEDDTEMEIEKKSFDVKEIKMEEQKPQKVMNEEKRDDQVDVPTSIPISEIVNKEPASIAEQPLTVQSPIESQKAVNEEEKVQQIPETPKPISANVNKQPAPVADQPVVVQSPIKSQKHVNEEDKAPQINETPKPISPILTKKPTSPVADKSLISQKLARLKKAMDEENKLPQIHDKPTTLFPNVNKQRRSVFSRPVINHDLRKSPSISEVYRSNPQTHNKLQSIVDLVMWRDIPKSAFVFGIGTFILLSSSFSKDINFSLISAMSYLGLIYLAIIFVYKSILGRGAVDIDDSNHTFIVGEEEAIWLVKLILPYLNEFLLKLRGLFSGHPATTMKLAILLFVLARCGSSITVWKMAKLGFFGVFTVPKICSSYSTQLTGCGKFWIRRFRDAWNSCSHKKAVAFGIFTLVWNLSSTVARIWAVFVLIVALKYYQQSLFAEEWGREDVAGDSRQEESGRRQGGRGPTLVKVKKAS